MSYDLFFYKRKGSPLTEQNIKSYLNDNLTTPNEQNNQWWFENEDTGVYFSFETTEKTDSKNDEDLYERLNEFEDVQFLFNLNFIRPDFFGKESFIFVNRFMEDLDLYVLNPQSQKMPDNPHKPQPNELYDNWSNLNAAAVRENSEDKHHYFPLNECNEIWNHNYNKWALQAKYDEIYYVPKIYLVEEFKSKRIVTQTSWTKHIPNIFPKTDYILIFREKNTVLRKAEEFGFISYNTFTRLFGDLLDDFELPNYKIIHPENAEKASKIFNSLKFEFKSDKLGNRISWDEVFNDRPNAIAST